MGSQMNNDNDQQKQNFLSAWKDGIRYLGKWGPVLFDGDTETATDREELRPRSSAIQDSYGVLSTGEQVFVGAMYSFFDPDDGQKLLVISTYENFVTLFRRLDPPGREIIIRLLASHYGW